VSRWDRLKGFAELLAGFRALKRRLRTVTGPERQRKRLEIVRLIFAGPDPGTVEDDPEAQETLAQICADYRALSPEEQDDVAVFTLPLESVKRNALMVNALQRCSTIVAQMSLQEGFGLTATEAMWKGVPVLGTNAWGLRQQIRDGLDGRLVADPRDPEQIAAALEEMLADPARRLAMGQSGQRRVHDEFLVFGQVRSWLRVLAAGTGR